MYHDKNATKTPVYSKGSASENISSMASIRLPHFFARTHPIMKLADGQVSGYLAEYSRDFEDLPSHAMVNQCQNLPSVCDWLEIAVKKTLIAQAKLPTAATGSKLHPILIPAPDALYQLADSSVQCENILSRTVAAMHSLHDITATCFVFKDTYLADTSTDRAVRLQAFRNHGLRLAIDWRGSRKTRFDESLARQFDAAIIPNTTLCDDPELLVRIYEARMAKIPVIADGAKWRDKDELAELGVNYVSNPLCDG